MSEESSIDGGAGGETAQVGTKSEIRILQDRIRKDGSHKTEVVARLDYQELPNDAEYAIVMRQAFTVQNALESTKVQINSPNLLTILRKVVGSHPSIASDFTEPFEMESPFQMLFHCWDSLVEHRDNIQDDVARVHLNLLLEFMKAEIGKDKEQCDAMMKKQQVTFARLWTIFPPGEMVYHEMYRQPWLLRVEKTAYEENKRMGKFLEVHCKYTDYDEEGKIGQSSYMIPIRQKQKFGGEQPANIIDLDTFPARFLSGFDSLIERLSNRGKKYLGLQGVLVKEYDGLAAYLKEPPSSFFDPDMAGFNGVWIPFTETGRVILDRETFYEDSHDEAVVVEPIPVNSMRNPPIGDPVFCCPYAYGYSLSRKEWCKYLVDNIYDINWNTNAFEDLVMKEDQKLLLQSLVTSHAFPSNSRDARQQKGKGLVVLLHGTPGSGKTLSAECAAEATGKGILSTTIGELNKYNYAADFEYSLKRILQYATRWKAIVLLDEADVFLEARPEESSANTERNALVAVFLRHLEYFSGIVFLTTNRIQVFDLAMKSRIHLALTFRPPDMRMRSLIWEQYLRRVPELDLDIDDVIMTLGRKPLNGREVSNAITTARTLARFQKQPLRMQHLQAVLKVRDDFTRDLEKEKEMVVSAAKEDKGSALAKPVRTNSILFAEGGKEE